METETPYFYADGSDPGEGDVLMEQIRDVLDWARGKGSVALVEGYLW